jgi:hypothetical protein
VKRSSLLAVAAAALAAPAVARPDPDPTPTGTGAAAEEAALATEARLERASGHASFPTPEGTKP